MEEKALKQLVNEILSRKGLGPVKNLATEFSDGILFQALFNILYEENVNCHLSTSKLVEDKVLNWNRINATICFNYLQQAFYLVTPTMKSLAKGTNKTAITKLLRVLIQTSQGIHGDEGLDDEVIRDIADVIEKNESVGGQLSTSGAVFVPKGKYEEQEESKDQF